MNDVITEITQLTDRDCYHLVERHKKQHTYPLHKHEEYELNFVEHGAGNRRIVGDSIETIGDYDLVLLGSGIEHVWEQHLCQSDDIREITIHFSRSFLPETFLDKTFLQPIDLMLQHAATGIRFEMSAIMRVYGLLNDLANMEAGSTAS